MEAFGMYLLKSAVWLSGFTLVFLVFLRNEQYFQLNRAFLLSGIFASIVFPFYTWHYAVILPSLPAAEISIPEFSDQAIVATVATPEPGIPIYWWFYILGIAFLAFRLIWQTALVISKLSKTVYVKNGPVKLVRTPEFTASFSFFSFVFVNPSTSDIEMEEIVNHECGHIQKRHWFDLLLVELLRILQWFNPFVWIYAHLVRQNHEYLADEMALKRTSNPAVYQATLLNQMLGVPVISLANSFSYSLNKKRFKMMKKKIDSPFRKLRMLMVLPLIAMVFFAFAKPKYIRPLSVSQTENVSAVNEGKEVNGKVTTPDGKPLQKATVVIKGTTIGTVTDTDGNFKLKEVAADAKLVISYVGMKSEELIPDFSKSMSVKMAVVTIGIEKVVVVGFNTPPASTSGKPAFSAIEQMPRFPGGQQALMGFIRDNLKYPIQAQEEKKTGTVVVNFLVSSTGKIENVKVDKSINPALDAEAVRVVSKMPDWFPGKQNGKPVDVYYSVPFEFTLQ